MQDGATQSNAPVKISLMIYYTDLFAENTPDIDGYLNEVIAETNQGYQFSGIPLTVEVLCKKQISMTDCMGCFFNPLPEFRSKFSSVSEMLNTADASILLTMGGSGRARGICTVCSNSPYKGENYAFAAKSYALGYYTFGHELGHLFGCYHNIEIHGQTNPYFNAYGYGWRIPQSLGGNKYRSIMAYPPGTRLNFYSKKEVYSLPPPLPSLELGSDKAQNNLVIKATMSLMAATGDESGTCGAATSSSTASSTSTTTITTSTTTTTSTTPLPTSQNCSDGWSEYKNSCYKASTNMKSWDDAEESCVSQQVSIHIKHCRRMINVIYFRDIWFLLLAQRRMSLW